MHPDDQTPRNIKQDRAVDWYTCAYCGSIRGPIWQGRIEICAHCGKRWQSVAEEKKSDHTNTK